MTRFGHKLNYVINTFVKHTPGHYYIGKYVQLHEFVVMYNQGIICTLLTVAIALLRAKLIYLFRFKMIKTSANVVVYYQLHILRQASCTSNFQTYE